ncbi:MAG: hypothetical protein Q9195_000299 [Heterodermia aff. obscurata]
MRSFASPLPAFLTLAVLASSTFAQGNFSSDAVGASPIFTDVPPVGVADPYVIAAITQKLALYDIAIDTKNFSALSGTFATDVVANVAPVPITSLAAYEAFLQADLAGSRTKHTTDTVFVSNIEPYTAQSISYSDAIYFGRGSALGQQFTFYERFDDVWSKDKVDGSWKISERTLVFFVCVDEASFF